MEEIAQVQMAFHRRVALKRALRIAGCPFENADSTDRLENLCTFVGLSV